MIRIKDFTSKVTLKAAVVLSALLLFAAAAAFGQQQINLTVAPTTATMPDGTIVPMWGYFCGTSVAGSTATCSSLNPNSLGAPPAWKASTAYTQGALIVDSNGNVQVATIGGTSGAAAPTWNTSGTTTDGGATGVTWTFQSSLATYLATAGSWSPIVITVPAGTSAAPAGLTINLTNDLSFAAGANNIPTSIVIVGQVGGGLGSAPTTTAPPDHSSAQGCVSWFIANNLPGTPCTSANNQGMATPPAQGPRIQSMGAEVAAGGTTPTALTWSALKPGTYLLESGTHPSIQVPMGLIGVLVVTNAPTGNGTATPAAGTAYPATANSVAVPYNAELPLEFSEIDPVQNKAVAAAVNTAGFTETAVWTAMNSLGAITSFHVTNPGSGYTSVPSVTIAPPVASGATATATATATAVMGLGNVAVTAGSGYNLGTTTVSLSGGGGTGATIASAWSLNNVAIAAGGSGYAVNDTFTVTGVGPSTATITVQTVDSSTTGVITGVTFTATGNFQLGPTTVTYNGQAGGKTGTGATLTPTFSLVSIAVTSGGTGYTSSPSVSITDTSVLAGTGATAVATLDVVAINVTNAGDGYGAAQIAAQTTAPIVTIGSAPTGGTTATATAAAAAGGCGTAHTCYPPAVNYTPFYYLINGVALNKTNAANSVFSATSGLTATGSPATTGITGTVLLRLVNAGLRMHTPSIVNSLTNGFDGSGKPLVVGGFSIIAEDGSLLPNVAPIGATTIPAAPRVQTDVLMVPSKVFDVLVNAPQPATAGAMVPALPIYARDLALSGNSSERDAGMLAYISVNNANAASGLPVAAGTGVFAGAIARPDTYPSLAAGVPFTVSDPSKGVIANDTNVYGVTLLAPPANGTITCGVLATPTAGLCANGTFTYTPSGTATSDSFTYCANGTVTGTTCSSGLTATVTLSPTTLTGGVTCTLATFNSSIATYLKVSPPGGLASCKDANNLPLSVVATSASGVVTGGTLVLDAKGGFALSVPSGTASTTFSFTVQNSLGTSTTQSATVNFPTPSGLKVNVLDAQLYANCAGNSTCINAIQPIPDYRWIIEEDETFFVDPNCTTNQSYAAGSGCPALVGPAGTSTIPTYGANFHTSTMNFVAQGCTGALSCEGGQTMLCGVNGAPACPAGYAPESHIPAVCDVGNGACRYDSTGNGSTWVNPSQVHLDPSKRYYISVLPGDAGNPFPSNVSTPVCPATGGLSPDSNCGHGMSGAPIPAACNILVTGCSATSTATFAPVNVLSLPTPLPTGKLSVIVFEDDFPLNGEQDGGGGQGTIAPVEPGLGGFNIVLWDTYGGLGDVTGQDSFDAFNQPLSNGLAGTIDPTTGVDACPISLTPLVGGAGTSDPTAVGMAGMIVTCPTYEADNQTLSPLAGQATIYNLMQDKFSVQAYPGADRIARGEQWLQTNTLDGQHPHDSFIRLGEPGYFQEYGPAGYHVAIGFANPAIINARHQDVCNGNGTPGTVGPCNNTVTGQINVQRLSRTPDQRLYPSGSHDALTWTQCWVSLGDPDGEDFMFQMCDSQGNFKFSNVPGGNWRLTIGDQWNDQIIDGLSIPSNVGCNSQAPNQPTNATTCPGLQTLNMGKIGVQQWQSNVYTKVFIDDNKNGVPDPGEIGIPLLYTRVYYRDGHNANGLATDFNGVANFNEEFPLFNWYVIEADSTRYKRTGIHTVYDAAGPADGSPSCIGSARPCGTSTAYNFLSNTFESVPLPADLSVPGAVYCAKADCMAESASFAAAKPIASSSSASTGRIDPPWVTSEGWAGTTSHGNWIDFGFAPYAQGENGGIHGQVTYASTRPFDDASQMILQPWEPLVPNVTINLYQEGFASDGVTPTLRLVDTTQTSSWDNWAQGFWPTGTAGTGAAAGRFPYMNCPGQGTNVAGSPNQDLFYFTLFDQPNYLDWYHSIHDGGTLHTLPYNSQYKCYDAMHIGNQLQPAPYDGEFSFPSVTSISTTTGKVNGTNCTICVPNPDSTDPWRFGTFMLPPGKYVVEAVMPPGYEIYKEEDKNLLIGDNYISPVTQQFAGLGAAIFILPDQASVASMYDQSGAGYNPTNFQNQTTATGLTNELSGVPGYPGFQDPVWPCVGEQRVVPDFLSLFPQDHETAPFAGATRPLCDRKEVTLGNQMNVRMHFAVFTSTHIAAKFTGGITDDFTSEFDPFSPQFGEKFAPPNMPVSTKDYLGNEISRVYSDHWGQYDGLTYSSWEVNPPNITGYSPSMMTQCMNDPGPIPDGKGGMMTDPLYNPAYSDFCYELPYMPGLTAYLDTPVVPTQAFVGAGYNNVDCGYPDATPGIKEVDGDGVGPWVHTSGVTLTITSIGDTQTNNNAYSGPSASVAPFNAKTVGRHYGFGAQCLTPTAGSATCNTLSSVTIGGRNATIDSWSDSQIQVTVPSGVPACPIQQQAQYQGTLEAGDDNITQCGELVITAGNGKQSVDSVTVTIGGKLPTHVSANQSVQSAIDAAAPGDLLIIDPTCNTVATAGSPSASATCSATALHAVSSTGAPAPTQTATAGSHTEMLIMWKPVRLQGVGAVSSVINANANPAGKLLDPWRRHVNCLFGLTLQGAPYTSGTNPVTSTTNSAPYDPSGSYSCPDAGWNDFSAQPNNPQIDRLPLEATIGWDATLNGNLAEQLQEPSLMGAFEGAGITVLAKGLEFHGAVPWGDGNEGGAFPAGTTLLTGVGPNPTALAVGDASPYCHTVTYSSTGTPTITSQTNLYPSNFMCNPSSIDGLTITNSSQGGGGIFAHGWAHHLQIANNRVYNNSGTLTGGISVGQGEFATPYVQGGATNAAPGSCSDGTGFVTNQHLPYCLQLAVNVHNNFVTNNSSLGDELFSGTLAGGGGVTVCTGNDYYKFNYNWVCGNLATGEGGGLVHLGEIQNGDIEHNSIILNQSQNPTIPTNGGGIQIMGTPDTDPVCGIISDSDCPPGLSDGVGHNLTINANLIQGNMAESGAGGGIRLQQVNGTEVSTFPTDPTKWNNVSITNNMIVNNVAGWDGGGISLLDALNVSIINNTIVSNDSLASSGVLTQSIGTPLASGPAGSCAQTGPTGATTASCPQVAGVASAPNDVNLTTTFGGFTSASPITCPFGEAPGYATTTGFVSCAAFSNPQLQNNVIWGNRSFYIGITGPGSAPQDQQNLVALYTAGGTAAPPQTAVGQCGAASYWDIGVRGDAWATGAPNHASGFSLNPTYSVLDDTGYASSNLTVNPNLAQQYCNGSRVPPTCSVQDGCGGPGGYGVPPGIADATTPNPVFTLNANATVDEGNNWVNVSWGPLSLADDSVMGGASGNYGGGNPLGNYTLSAGSPAIDYVPVAQTHPTTDFFGNPRPDPANPGHFDVGAIETQNTSGTATLTSISPSGGQQGTVVNVTITGTGLTLASAVNVGGGGIAVGPLTTTATTVSTSFTIAANAALTARNVTVTTPAGTSNPVTFTVVAPPLPTLTSIAPAFEVRGTAQGVLLTGTNFIAGSTVVLTPAATGVTVSNVVVTSPTTITATITSTAAAAVGNVNVEVITSSGASNTLPFGITGPVLTAISPASSNRNTTGLSLTLTGSGFLANGAATSANFSGNGITVTSFTVNSDTSITAVVNISASATPGARNVTVTGVGGTSNAVTFTVTVPPAGLFSIAPNTGARGTVQPVVLTGQTFATTGFPSATGITVTGGGITVSGFTVVNDTTINANFTIAVAAALTARNVSVNLSNGTTTTPVTFTVVNPGTPIINSITPNSGLRGPSVPVTIAGSNFTAGSTVNVVAPGNGLFVTGVTIVSPTQINATFNTTGTATIGPRSITVTNPGGTSAPATYTVLGPVLNSISPTSALRGTGTPVGITLNGSGFLAATAVNVTATGGGSGGVTVGPITVVNDNQITTTFTISATAAGTARNVTVTAPGGTSNAVTFTVLVPGTPTLSSVSPATGVRGTTALAMTLTGTNFGGIGFGPTTVAVSGAGVTVSGVSVVSPTTITANFAISATATLGAHNVSVTVAGAAAASNTVPFTVQGATLTSISPNTGLRGTTVAVTFTGANIPTTGAVTVSGLGGTGITANSVTVVNSTTVTANLVISTGATVGIDNIGLTTPIGTTNLIPFTVTGATLTAISPTSATHPATGTLAVPVTITGTNLSGTTALTGLGTGVTATGITSTSTSISATLNVSSTATTGARTIGATTAAGATTNTVTFTVN